MKVSVEGRDVNVHELTVSEVRAWFAELATQANAKNIDLVNEMLFEDISLREVTMLTDLSQMQLESMRPSSLVQLIQSIIAINPHWHSCRKRIMAVAEKIRAANQQGNLAAT